MQKARNTTTVLIAKMCPTSAYGAHIFLDTIAPCLFQPLFLVGRYCPCDRGFDERIELSTCVARVPRGDIRVHDLFPLGLWGRALMPCARGCTDKAREVSSCQERYHRRRGLPEVG